MNRQKQFQIRLQVIQVDDFKCRIVDLSRDYKTGAARLTVETESNIFKAAEELFDKDLTCRLVRFRKRRSLDANAYFWVLLNKLADKMNTPAVETYRRYIKHIGGNNTIICVPDKAVDDLISGWEHNGIGWQTETQESKLKGCTNVILYYGSSTYDTKQMSRLIDMVVQDCQSVGISTMTPRELATLMQGWSNE